MGRGEYLASTDMRHGGTPPKAERIITSSDDNSDTMVNRCGPLANCVTENVSFFGIGPLKDKGGRLDDEYALLGLRINENGG
jgi:hypothetical protein